MSISSITIITLISMSLFASAPKSVSFEKAQASFDKEFPRSWPPKQTTEPFTPSQTGVVEQIANSLSALLDKSGIDYKKTSKTTLLILPSDATETNKVAKTLAKDNISMKYDAIYFAKNPFSAGTFIDNDKVVLLSHRALKDADSVQAVLSHELNHVQTYKDRISKKVSPFYCQFKGKQFAPHLLACDEMKAYNSDIKKLLAKEKKSSDLKLKITSAKMHTELIPKLIEKLDLSTTKIKNRIVIINGKNENGDFWIEFPEFTINKGSQLLKAKAIAYLKTVSDKAIEYSQFIKSVETKN